MKFRKSAHAIYKNLRGQENVGQAKWVSGFRARVKTSITIGILPLKETIAKAVGLTAEGFSIL
jgi:hypothetical protein